MRKMPKDERPTTTGDRVARGVYIVAFGGLTELSAVDSAGDVVRRLTVRTDFYTDADLEHLQHWLDRVSPPGAALRLV